MYKIDEGRNAASVVPHNQEYGPGFARVISARPLHSGQDTGIFRNAENPEKEKIDSWERLIADLEIPGILAASACDSPASPQNRFSSLMASAFLDGTGTISFSAPSASPGTWSTKPLLPGIRSSRELAQPCFSWHCRFSPVLSNTDRVPCSSNVPIFLLEFFMVAITGKLLLKYVTYHK
jgi:hypothetical protein